LAKKKKYAKVRHLIWLANTWSLWQAQQYRVLYLELRQLICLS
jgi:hypothetical protein